MKRRDGWDHPAGVRSAPKEVLDLQVTRNTLDRGLRPMDALLKSLEPRGFTVQVDEEKRHTPKRNTRRKKKRGAADGPYEEARARYETQVRERNEERRQLRALFRDASRLQRANRLREFIAAVEDRARHDDELTPEKQQWLEWAKAKADWLDPLVRRSDPILDAPEPQAPSYWSF